jgi:phosphoribosylformylglycinamidine cyclo-ligase
MMPVPPLFNLIQDQSKTDWREMYKVFNMGHRMEIYTDEKTAQEIIEISNSFHIDAQIVGYVEDANEKSVEIHTKSKSFSYQ